MKKFLGLEFGSTRIKAVLIDETFATVSSGDYTWKSSFENGVWTYPLEEAWKGLNAAISGVQGLEDVAAVGVSGMMHGYLAFDADWNLLVPFRTWQNTMTAQAAEELTELFGFNIPQRWSIAHLYQAVLNGAWPTSPRWLATSTTRSPASTPSAWARPPACSPSTTRPAPTTRPCWTSSTR